MQAFPDARAAACLLRAQARYEEAEPLFRRALEIREKALGKDHPSTKIARDNLDRLLGTPGADRTPLA